MARNLFPRVTRKPIVPAALAQCSRRRLLKVTAAGIAVTVITFGGAEYAFAAITSTLPTALATVTDPFWPDA